jgi:DNA repair protein RecN (Recombination protein N)
MLLELAIHDFAIIEQVRVCFAGGYTALTGETGAGKSILIDAIGVVLGDRVGSDVVRTGAKAARIEAIFDASVGTKRQEFRALLTELGIETDEEALILSREIAASGRSTARLNGRAVPSSVLARVGSHLVDIHGQSDHLSLLRPAEHLDMLDRFAGLLGLRGDVAASVRELRAVRRRINDLQTNASERERHADLLRFQVEEIEGSGLREGEEEELLAERMVLINAERIAVDAASAYALIAGDDIDDSTAALPVRSALQQAGTHLADIVAVDPAMAPIGERLSEVIFGLEDIAAEIRDYRDEAEADPARLAVVEDRLDDLKRLQRKYGDSVEEVIAFRQRAATELEAMSGAEENVEALRGREASFVAAVTDGAGRLSSDRKVAGERLGAAVERAIGELNMGRARFAVGVTHRPDPDGIVPPGDDPQTERVAVDETGIDRVEFLIAPNAGETLKPLGRIASGGETARVMLALKSVLAETDDTPTLIFDEVDVGVGARSGQVVGEKLWRLSTGHQVLVITHLPQIAAFASVHFRIGKGERAGRIVSSVEAIDGEERVDELAAMLDGLPVTEASRTNAAAMLDRVTTWKTTAAGG